MAGRVVVLAAVLALGALGPGTVPGAPPPGCSPTTSTFANPASQAITDPGTTTSSIVVSGVAPVLFDVNVATTIAHTSTGQLSVAVTSPAGTVVTLTSENGGISDNVFNGTVWDDQANDPVSAYHFSTGVIAQRLSPEDKLDAFRGQDPNGTWTLTVVDNAAGESGTLNGWSLDLTTLPTAPTTQTVAFEDAPRMPIPDESTIHSTIGVSGLPSYVLDVNLFTDVRHPYSSDLSMTLVSPLGTAVTVTNHRGRSFRDVFAGTLWDDSADPGSLIPYAQNPNLVTDHTYVDATAATPLVPEAPLAAFLGEDPNGTWTLFAADDSVGDAGTLNRWRVDITTGGCGITTTTLPGGCTTGATFDAVDCRLAQLARDVTAAVAPGPLANALLDDIGAASTKMSAARAAASVRLQKKALKQALRELVSAKRGVSSKRARKSILESTRQALVATLAQLQADVKTLRGT